MITPLAIIPTLAIQSIACQKYGQKAASIDKAYDYVWNWCDNPEECDTDTGFDFSNASWGTSAQNIIEYLETLI